MTLQNRVTPFGEIVAVPMRGDFIGNRGIIHDPATKTLLQRRWTTKAWIICALEFKGRHREVMARRSWTELFFLDEAVALAAGHRPCFECRRADAERFRQAWATGNGGAVPSAPAMDATLHAQRLDGKAKRLHPLVGPPEALPDGAMLAAGAAAFLVAGGRLWQWTPTGYRTAAPTVPITGLLTPPATLGALRGGYRPQLHASVGA